MGRSWPLLAVIALLAVAPTMANARVSGAIVSTSGSEGHRLEGTFTTTCTVPSGCDGRIEVISRPRMAKITRPPKVKCKTYKHSVECRIVKPATAYFTRCDPTLSSVPEAWSPLTVSEWLQQIGEGHKFVTKDPPIRVAYFGETSQRIDGGTERVEFSGDLPNGTVEPCLYLLRRTTVTVPKEECLPDLAPEIREEFCATEYISTVETLGRGLVKFGN